MPPKNLLKVYGLIFAIALAAVVVVTMIVISTGATGTHKPETQAVIDRDNLVRVQVRAPKRATVVMNGRPKGQTPIMLLVPRSSTPLDLSITLGGRVFTKQVTPTDDSVVDFP